MQHQIDIPPWRRWSRLAAVFGGIVVPGAAILAAWTSMLFPGNNLVFVSFGVLMPGALPGIFLGEILSIVLQSYGIQLDGFGKTVVAVLLAAPINVCFYYVLPKWLWSGIVQRNTWPLIFLLAIVAFCALQGWIAWLFTLPTID